MIHNILVTAYTNPDLDGTACAIAYAEFLQKKDIDAVAGVFGIPHREAQFVFKHFSIPSPVNAEKVIIKQTKVIIVDSSDLNGISPKINPLQVIEVIDHRKVHEADKFPNAKIQIELVGSCATLIAEKFYQEKINISKTSAALLYSAIISNTVNFRNKVTTNRDKEIALWLQGKIDVSDNYAHLMFVDKSKFSKPLKEVFLDDFAFFNFSDKKTGIAQLEIVNVESFIETNLDEIKKVLHEIKQEKSMDMIFLTCIDTEKGCNELVAIDQATEKLLDQTLFVSFHNGIAKRNKIIMRKEIVPLLKSFLEKH